MSSNISEFGFSAASAWEIAKYLGIEYTGDANPIDHDGTFYAIHDDYVECLRISSSENTLWVECGSRAIDTEPDEDIADCYGIDVAEITPHHRADYAMGMWGIDVHEDFGGEYRRTFQRIDYLEDDTDDDAILIEDGERFTEEQFWQSILGWLEGLPE